MISWLNHGAFMFSVYRGVSFEILDPQFSYCYKMHKKGFKPIGKMAF